MTESPESAPQSPTEVPQVGWARKKNRGRRQYAAFVSYRHGVLPGFVGKLELALKQYAKPVLSPPLRIFRDENHFAPNIDLPSMIRAALEDSDFLILLASRDAAQSPWVREELSVWCGAFGRTANLIIVLLDGEILSTENGFAIDWEKTTALSPVLKNYLQRIPLFVDMRWAGQDALLDLANPDFKRAVNAIVARLKGVDPNELSGVEVKVHRQNIRMRNRVLGGLIALSLTAAAAGIFAWRQRTIAIGERDAAERQKQLAVEALDRRLLASAMEEIDRGSLAAARRWLGEVSTISWPWLFLYARAGPSQPPSDFTDHLIGWRQEAWKGRLTKRLPHVINREPILDPIIGLHVGSAITTGELTARWKEVGDDEPTGVALYRTANHTGLVGYRSEPRDLISGISVGSDGSFAVVCATGGEVLDSRARVTERFEIDLPTEPCDGRRHAFVIAVPERYCLPARQNCAETIAPTELQLPWVTALSQSSIDAVTMDDAKLTLWQFAGKWSRRPAAWYAQFNPSAVGIGEPSVDQVLARFGVRRVGAYVNGPSGSYAEDIGDVPLAGVFLRKENPVVVVNKANGQFELRDARDMRVKRVIGKAKEGDAEVRYNQTAAMSADGRWMALYPVVLGDGDSGIVVVDLVTGAEVTMLNGQGQPFGASRFVGPQRRRLAFSPAANRLMLFETQTSIGDQLVVWDTASGVLSRRWGCKECRDDGSALPVGEDAQKPLTPLAVAWHPRQEFVVVMGRAGTATLLSDIQGRTLAGPLNVGLPIPERPNLHPFAFGPIGNLVVAESPDHQLVQLGNVILRRRDWAVLARIGSDGTRLTLSEDWRVGAIAGPGRSLTIVRLRFADPSIRSDALTWQEYLLRDELCRLAVGKEKGPDVGALPCPH